MESSTTLRRLLQGTFAGPTVASDDPSYDADRAVWNATVDRRPALIAICTDTADVVTAVRAAREAGVPLSVRGGGHQVAGLSVCDDGLVLDLSGLRGGAVDASRRVAMLGGGSLLRDADRTTQEHGFLVPAGVISHTGLGGLALGGGVGWTCRHFGLTCDNIVGAEVVTADGTVVHVSDDEHAELLWALRGGGGNFGVVTTFEMALQPVTSVLFGQAVFAAQDAARVVAHYEQRMAQASRELTCVLVAKVAPDLSTVPPELVGRPVLLLNAVWSGAPGTGEDVVRGMVEGAGPVVARVTPTRYLDLQTMQDDMHPHGLRNHMKSRYLDRLDQTVAEVLERAADNGPSPMSQIEVLALGGAVADIAEDATAFCGRDAGYIANVVATWHDAEDDETNVSWARAAYAGLAQVGSDGGYVNFLGEEPERARSVYADGTYERLQALKAAIDPHDVFHGNVPISPALAGTG